MIWAWIWGSSLHSDVVREKPPPANRYTPLMIKSAIFRSRILIKLFLG